MNLDTLVAARLRDIAIHKEKLLEAWIAETGYLPSESVVIQQTSGMDLKLWVEKKHGDLPKHEYPKMDMLEAENLQLRECLEFYENEDNWNGKNKTAHWDSMNCALEDHGNRAREALKKLQAVK